MTTTDTEILVSVVPEKAWRNGELMRTESCCPGVVGQVD